MVMRYAMLVVIAAASIWALFNVGATRAPMLLVDAGYTSAAPSTASGDVALWLLGTIALLITLSLGRFVFFGLPSMVGGWYQEHKSWIYTLIGGGALYVVFYLM
jgi:hypothetical protein